MYHCTFGFVEFGPETLYTCFFTDVNIKKPGMSITEISGTHIGQRTNKDVQAVDFTKCYLYYLPRKLNLLFPNIKALIVLYCGLREITKLDIEDYELEYLFVHSNPIKRLPDDLLAGQRKLKELSFYQSNISDVSSKMFSEVNKAQLRYVDFYENGKLSVFFPPDQKYKGSKSTIDELLEAIDEICGVPRGSEVDEPAQSDNINENDVDMSVEVEDIEIEEREISMDLDDLISEPDEADSSSSDSQSAKPHESEFSAGTEYSMEKPDFLIYNNDVRFYVHKDLLTRNSELMKKKLETDPGNAIRFEVFSPAGMKDIIDSLYKNRDPDDLHVFEAFRFARIYGFDELAEKSGAKILSNFNVHNSYQVLQLGVTYRHPAMIKKWLDYVEEHFAANMLKK